MKRKAFFKATVLLIILILATIWNGPGGIPAAQAYDEPLALNLGFTSFLDGAPPAGPGFYLTQYFQYIHASKLVGVPPPVAGGENLNGYVFLTQFIYQSNYDLLFGGKWGLDFILPVAVTQLTNTSSGLLRDNGAGLSNIYIGPYLQWDPVNLGCNGPLFMHRLELQFLLPTGKYSSDKEVNPGSNFFSFDPYWAQTLFITPKWEFSTRIHYLWNAQNNDPNRYIPSPDGSPVDNTRAGQAVHLNFASSYEVIDKMLHAGINGYYLKQTTDTQVNGQSVAGRKEQVLGLGPGFVFHFSRDSHLFVNVYFETAVDNRPEGQRYNLRYVYHF